ncbi:hypothetical protein [Azospirillum griseum]|uniref:hypothetical protein n=1 Tax=Azospirillum griseum TaxID=2496639 RepID=UPI001315891B|nr:hypothetical protein [Azospirillum griseum]
MSSHRRDSALAPPTDRFPRLAPCGTDRREPLHDAGRGDPHHPLWNAMMTRWLGNAA